MKNQLDQLVEVMIALTNKEDNIQRTVVTKTVAPPQVNDQTQAQPIQIPIENPSIRKHPNIRDGHS